MIIDGTSFGIGVATMFVITFLFWKMFIGKKPKYDLQATQKMIEEVTLQSKQTHKNLVELDNVFKGLGG